MSTLASQAHIRAERRRFRRAQNGQAWTVRDLPQFYYHRNFSEIIDGVASELQELLASRDTSFLNDFKSLPFASQCAYVRLAGRKGRVFHVDKFKYDEIEDLPAQYELLTESGFTSRVTPGDFRDYLSSLSKPDLVGVLSHHACPTLYKKSWKKDVLVEVAYDAIAFDELSIPDTVVVQGRLDALNYLLYLFSGRIDDSLQNLTLRDLGLVKMQKSEQHFGTRFGSLRAAKTAWFYASGLHNFRREEHAEVQRLMASIETWPEPLCAQSTGGRDKLVQSIGGLLERKGQLEAALRCYDQSDAPRCNERVVRLKYKLGEKDWVQTRLEAMIENPTSDDEHAFAQDFYARKYKKKRTSIITDILRDSEVLELDEAFRNQPERAAAEHYRAKGLACFRAENTPWKNLFGLLFWEELFPDTVSRSTPMALKSGDFYADNQAAIEAKLRDLDTPHLIMIKLLKTLTAHYGEPQSIVKWRSKSLDRIQALVENSPKGSAAYMLRLMAQEWTRTKDGFPDLLVIQDDTCRLVEIKATGDVIRRNQLTRLRQLRAAGYRADILRVEWTIDPDQTYVVVDVETTGGRPGLHRVTEIGAVKVKGGKVIDEWSSLINPQRSIPPNITRITGITHEMVADAPIFAEVAESFANFMGDAIFAAHNVNFDYGFISAEFQMVDQKFRHPKICTCASMRKLYPGYPSYSLKNLCREFHIDLKSHHRALCDAKAAAELLFLVNERRIEDA